LKAKTMPAVGQYAKMIRKIKAGTAIRYKVLCCFQSPIHPRLGPRDRRTFGANCVDFIK